MMPLGKISTTRLSTQAKNYVEYLIACAIAITFGRFHQFSFILTVLHYHAILSS